MAAHAVPMRAEEAAQWQLAPVAAFPRLRVLAWNANVLYASRGYQLLSANLSENAIAWHEVGRFRPALWRNLSCRSRLASRLVRDGFHALAALPSGHLVAAIAGAIVTLRPGETEFRVSHKILRGTRPLHITATPDGRVFWGGYFDNPHRDEVHIFTSRDFGSTWEVIYTFPKCTIRHVHNIVHDSWENCLWVLTGDHGSECRILRASLDFKQVDIVVSGNQQARSGALILAPDALYFSTDTPLESNRIFRLSRNGTLSSIAELSSSSICGCRVGEAIFFSTMVEPSEVNADRHVRLYGSRGGAHWLPFVEWEKDRWSMRLFQYGNAFLPDGQNDSPFLALTTIATRHGDLETSIWRVVET